MEQPLKDRMGSKIAAFVSLVAILALAPNSLARVQQNLSFIVCNQGEDNTEADRTLRRYLLQFRGDQGSDLDPLNLDLPEATPYEEAVRRLANWKESDGEYLAHMTPYTCVAAEMLGAKFEVLATTRLATTEGKTTYHSYFVVNKEAFEEVFPSGEAYRLSNLTAFLKAPRPDGLPRFIFHDKFSTSSYFLPSIYLRGQRIFDTTDSLRNITAIRVEKARTDSSSDLVKMIAQRKADLAAVWDGTKSGFADDDEFGSKVRFMKLPTPLPNDLLVCSASLDPQVKGRIREAIRNMPENHIGLANIREWEDIEDAYEAREALARLRRLAAQPPAPVTVEVMGSEEQSSDYVEIARQAIRLSATEFVVHDEHFHRNPPDVSWTLTPIHDGAVVLEAGIAYSDLDPQQFQISFTDDADLLRRIGNLIHSRMHRIRFVWLYQDRVPTVIRDFDFPVVVESRLKAQEITWTNFDRHEFQKGDFFDVTVENSDFFKIELSGGNFPKKDNRTFDFKPLLSGLFCEV